MHLVLSRASRGAIERLARERTLCAFDFDGTLAPIVAHPHRAALPRRTRTLLARLATLYPCVVISGRARADVLQKLRGVNVARVIGNHGAETGTGPRPSRQRVKGWVRRLTCELASLPGVSIEDKHLSVAVHYRHSARKPEARRRILAAARDLERVRVLGGKQVVNLVVDTSHNKGDALAAERERQKCSWVLYVGDDDNDEDAFALSGHIVSVRVGQSRRSRARYYLRAQKDIDGLLERLIDARVRTR